MNTILFKQSSPQQSSTEETKPAAKQVEGNGRCAYPPCAPFVRDKFHSVQDKIRKISGIGWAIVVPTALGAVLGLWMDTLWPAATYSWVHLLFPIGALIGCLMAIIWVYQDPAAR